MSQSTILSRYHSLMSRIKRIDLSMSLKKVVHIAIIEPSKEDRAILEMRLKRAFKSSISLILVPYIEFYISKDVDLYIIVDRDILRNPCNWRILWKKLEQREGKILFVSHSPYLNLPKGMNTKQVDLAYTADEIIKYVKEHKQSLQHK